MSYSNNTLSYLSFDSLPINDYTGKLITYTGGQPTLVPGVFNSAYQLENNKTLYINYSFGTFTQLSISFWLKPTNNGVALVNNSFNNMISPLISQGLYLVTPQSISLNKGICIYELQNNTGNNQIAIGLNGYSSGYLYQNALAISNEYTPNTFHHFCFIFNGLTSTISIYVDGILSVASVSGTVPYQVNSSFAGKTGINLIAPGLINQVSYNTGVIDDLGIFSNVLTFTNIKQIIDNGVDFYANLNYANIIEEDQVILFDDPSSVQLNTIYSNKGNTYIGKSDGSILKAVKTLWQSRKYFYSTKEFELLDIINKNPSTNAEVINGKLNLTSQTVRI